MLALCRHTQLQPRSLEILQLGLLAILRVDMLEDFPAIYMVFAQGSDQRVVGKRQDEVVN